MLTWLVSRTGRQVLFYAGVALLVLLAVWQIFRAGRRAESVRTLETGFKKLKEMRDANTEFRSRDVLDVLRNGDF